MGISPAYAQILPGINSSAENNLYEFGYQQHPQKLLENTEGVIQVYVLSGDKIFPTSIKGMKVTSSDNSIIQIKEIQSEDSEYSTKIKIHAIKPGIADISLAAPGFNSQVIHVTIYNNNNYPTKILLKTTPNEFPIDGPKTGYVGIELATTGDLPTIALEDTTVKISTPNTDVIRLQESEIIIPKGEYYALTKFDIRGSGDAIIFAETEGMKKISEFVKVKEAAKPLKLQLYVFPENFNSFSSQNGYAIVQLQDAEGIPVKTEKEIELFLNVENPDSGINTSHDFEEFQFDSKKLTISEGKYSTFTSFTPRPNISDFTESLEQTYNFFIIADDYITQGATISVTHDEIGALEGKGPAITQTIPFLATGERELLGVAYFETDVEVSRQLGTSTLGVTNRETATVTVPVMASEDFAVNVASSSLDTVNVENIFFKKGENAALIFGNTGTSIPEEKTVQLYVTDNKQTNIVSATPHGPVEDDLNLTIEPLIPKILANSEFPLIGYLIESSSEEEETTNTAGTDEEEEDGRIGVTHFIKDTVLTFSADENFEISSEIISRNQEYAVFTPTANKIGTSTITAQASGLETQLTLQSHTTDPTKIELSYAKNILPMTSNLASIQLLDSVGNPVYTKTAIQLEIVSNNQNSLTFPENIIFEKGEYFKAFEITASSEGITEIAILAEDLPMANFELIVEGYHPEISLIAPNAVDQGNPVTAELVLQYSESSMPVENFQVTWNVLGGIILEEEITTNANGKARITIDQIEEGNLEIQVSVNGLGFTNLETRKQIKVIPAPIIESTAISETENMDLFTGNNIILFAIPGVAGAAFLYLRKTNRLEDITERLNISEKIEGVKERISEIRER